MENPRKYGRPPFNIAVIHGGPGAGGEMAPVAKEIAVGRGVLEPLQTADTLEGQVDELKRILEEHGDLPAVVIGYSWGAWLSYILAARYPALVKKLILVASGPFEEKYAAGILPERLRRLDRDERTEVESLMGILSKPGAAAEAATLTRFGALLSRADTYDPVDLEGGERDQVECHARIFQNVWPEADRMRRSGELLALGRHIKCPVVAIHGDYDPHPAQGVAEPLSGVIGDFRMIRLEYCGHTPWKEKRARERFYAVLNQELA
jgi:pimeloyl-ACP methyl ester carboxylesterase